LNSEKAEKKCWSAMAKAFTRIGKDIVIAVEGGPNPEANSRLRAVIKFKGNKHAQRKCGTH
jgi:transcriptional/translational regulatory protein YebC/TACO1